MRRTLATLAASGALVLVGAGPAVADDCNVFINPEDCRNTAWTVGVTATVAAAAAAVTGLTRSGRKGPMPRDEGECGAELYDLDQRLNTAEHAIQTATSRYNRAAMRLEEQYAAAFDELDRTGSDAALRAAHAARGELLRGGVENAPMIHHLHGEAISLWEMRDFHYRDCLRRGLLPAGTWHRPKPRFDELFSVPEYSPDNRPAIDAPGVRTPESHDEVITSLGQPGTTIIDPSNAHSLGPPEFINPDGTIRLPADAPAWASPLNGARLPPVTIRDGTVESSVGIAGARVAVVNDNGRIGLQGDYWTPLGGGDVDRLRRLQEQLDRLNERMREAGVQVTGIQTSGSQIRIQTGPIED